MQEVCATTSGEYYFECGTRGSTKIFNVLNGFSDTLLKVHVYINVLVYHTWIMAAALLIWVYSP